MAEGASSLTLEVPRAIPKPPDVAAEGQVPGGQITPCTPAGPSDVIARRNEYALNFQSPQGTRLLLRRIHLRLPVLLVERELIKTVDSTSSAAAFTNEAEAVKSREAEPTVANNKIKRIATPSTPYSFVTEELGYNRVGAEVTTTNNTTTEQVKAKEVKLELHSAGQQLYIVGAQVTYEGGTWVALKENCGVEPGSNPAVWVSASPAVVQYEYEPGVWFPFSQDALLPQKAPQLKGVAAVAFAGAHGNALMLDGTVRFWGYVGFGITGTGWDGSYGPKPRPLTNPPKVFVTMPSGTTANASMTITECQGIKAPAEKNTANPIFPGKVKNGVKIASTTPEGAWPPGTEITGYIEATPTQRAEGKGGTITVSKPANFAYKGGVQLHQPAKEHQFYEETQKINPGFPVTPITTGYTVTAIATGTNTGASPWTLALTSTGEILSWGANRYGQLGCMTTTGPEAQMVRPSPVLESPGKPLKGITAVCCGEYFSLAVSSDHKVWMWGLVDFGEGGAKPLAEGLKLTATPIVVEGLPGTVVGVAAASKTAYAILENGDVWSWGANEHGELGNGTVAGKKSSTNLTPWVAVPAKILGLSNIAHVEGGREHAAAVNTSGELFMWGGDQNAAIGDNIIDKAAGHDKGTPVHVDCGAKVLQAAVGEYNTIALLEGSTAPANPLQVRLVPEGEVAGEQTAYLKMRWRATAKLAGWKLTYKSQLTWLEEKVFAEAIAAIQAEIEESEAAEKEILEGELQHLEEEQATREGAPKIQAITPAEISAGVYEYVWQAPTRLTPRVGYNVHLQNGTEANWFLPLPAVMVKAAVNPAPTIATNWLWGSPLSFAAF